jgi:high-affinity iron transporter
VNGDYRETRRQLPHLASYLPVLIIFLILVFDKPVMAQELTIAEQLRNLAHTAADGQTAAGPGQTDLVQAEYAEIHETWESLENEVRQQDSVAYVELEGALHRLEETLHTEPLDLAAVSLAYDHLFDEANEFADRFDRGAATPVEVISTTPAELVKSLDAAYAAIEQDDIEAAEEQISTVMRAWPSVEGAIATRSPEAYNAIEVELGRAAAALAAQPANLVEAEAAIEQLRATLTPFVGHQTYTAFDAAAIMLREGLEALLVMVALLAFLRRSGNQDKRHWIWLGGALGVLVSIVTALVLHMVFSLASSGQRREVIEGITGLVAAGLLFYVSYWLHSKASLRGWQNYLDSRTGRVLKQGSVLGLALLAFLAVFREGAETAVFYLGMAPSIALSDLLLGLGLGSTGLVVAAVLMLVVGVRLPLKLFFRVASLLVYYLGFKFLGTGIHALQVAGVLPASLIGAVPTVPFAGIYPTWETIIPQLLLLVVAVVAFLYLRQQTQRSQTTRSSAAT